MFSIISLLDRGATTTTACYNTLVGILSCDYNNVLFFGHWRWMVRETISEFLLPSSQNTLNFTNPNCSSSPVNLTIITTNTITVQCRPPLLVAGQRNWPPHQNLDKANRYAYEEYSQSCGLRRHSTNTNNKKSVYRSKSGLSSFLLLLVGTRTSVKQGQ